VPALFAALGDPSEPVRAAAAQALSRIGPGAADVASLAAALASSDPYVAAFAAWSLGNLEAEAAPAVTELGRALARAEMNDVVTRALSRIGPAAAAAVPDLVRELGAANDVHRWRAARTLGRIGPGAEPALAALTAALKDPSGAVRMHAARALGRIGPAAKPAAAALQRTTGDRDVGVRDAAREALERIGGRPD
jgi:HEAT repeat protein